MGKSFVSLDENGYDLRRAFNLLIKGEVVEASAESYFKKKPSFREVIDIEIGVDGTKQSQFLLKNGEFVVVDRTIDVDALR